MTEDGASVFLRVVYQFVRMRAPFGRAYGAAMRLPPPLNERDPKHLHSRRWHRQSHARPSTTRSDWRP
jgi:hypothetical protein